MPFSFWNVVLAKLYHSYNRHCPSSKSIYAFIEYINLRKEQPHFANARSIRNALDRARLRQANRLFKENNGCTR